MSAILSADDLNDFISPGVACIKPIEVKNAIPRGSSSNNDHIEIEIGIDGAPIEVSKDEGTSRPLEQLQISLSDCLACSGCITSAEEVLVAQHSHKELINALKVNSLDKKFVVSLSHQARASIAGAYGLSIEQADKFLVNLFINKLGFSFIVGMGLGRKISLQQSSMELINKKLNDKSSEFPILSSACPGFILYAEKTHPELIPRISDIKSPQQITGLILKKISSLELQESESNIYHLSIMPCFDKKLELARTEKDYETGEVLEEEKFKDVDCVITPKELIQLLMDENFNIEDLIAETRSDATNIEEIYRKFAPKYWPNPVEGWLNDDGSSSGGYGLQYLLNYQQFLLRENGVSNTSIIKIDGRNSDISEYRLINNDTNEKLASSAIVNGFRNIQNIVRKLKNGSTKKTKNLIVRRRARDSSSLAVKKDDGKEIEMADLSKCDYVEIMACPSGCINGGGQITSPDSNIKTWINSIEDLYYSIPISKQDNYTEWIKEFCDQFNVDENRLLKMKYNEVAKIDSSIPTALAIGSKW